MSYCQYLWKISLPYDYKLSGCDVGLRVVTAPSTEITVFWDVAARSLAEIDRRFGDSYRLSPRKRR